MSRLRTLAAVAFLVVSSLLVARAQGGSPVRVRDVVYGYKYGMALTLDVVKPARPSGIGVLFMVSGGYTSTQQFIDGFVNLTKPCTDRGQTVFFVCHGSQPKYTLEEIVTDIKRAVRFVRAHASDYGVDPNRLGISGASSGGHLSLITAATGGDGDPKAVDPIDRVSDRLQAVACFFPPTDFLNYGAPGRLATTYEPVKFVWHVFGALGKPADEQAKILKSLSPFQVVTRDMPPTLIIQGDNDPLVPFEQAVTFDQKLEELHVPHQLILKKGLGHSWPGIEMDVPALADWFDRYLPAHGSH